MRKSKFLLSLIAATAIGLSAAGCDSSSSGSIADTTDLSVPNNNNNGNEQRSLREYMLVAQRGLETFGPSFGTGQSAPAGGEVVAAPGDADITAAPPQLWELSGIADTPNPNANLTAPGNSTSSTPSTPDAVLTPSGASGFHEIYASPTGTFAIGVGRSKNRGFATDSVDEVRLQIFTLEFEQPLDVVFPPNIVFNAPAANENVFFTAPNQGEFVSGAWSPNAAQFYASVNNQITVFSIDGTVGGLEVESAVDFPDGPVGQPPNNAVKMIASPNGASVYALDNANGQMVTYSRNTLDGSLTLAATSPVVSDPRGMTVDRSGNFMYVVGRSSEQVAGYRIEADGSLTPIDVLPEFGLGPVPFNFGEPLGDIAANPRSDQLFLTTYLGVMQAYTINQATGGLTPYGESRDSTGGLRNIGNIEVEPTGRFVISAHEHDFDAFQSFVTAANGFPLNEDVVFANTDSATNGVAAFSPAPNLDLLGRIVYILPIPLDSAQAGALQVWRINQNLAGPDDPGVRVVDSQPALNPYGLSFFQKVLQAPAGDGSTPIQP